MKMIFFINRVGMGDFLCQLPTIRELYLRKYKEITLLLPLEFDPLVQNLYYIKNRMTYSKPTSPYDLGKMIQQVYNYQEYTIYYPVLPPRFRIGFMEMFPNQNVFGFWKKEFAENAPFHNSRIERYAFGMGVKLSKQNVEINQNLNGPPLPTKKPNVGLAAGSPDAKRCISQPDIITLANKLTKSYYVHILHHHPIPLPKRKGILNLTGKQTLEQACYTIQQLNCLITPDTGLLHVALALNTPVITWMGPSPRKAVINPVYDHLVTECSNPNPNCSQSCSRFRTHYREWHDSCQETQNFDCTNINITDILNATHQLIKG